MQPHVAALAVSLALAFSTSLHAQTAADTSGNNAQSTSSSGASNRASGAANERSQNQKESSRQQCDKMEGNAKAICNAQADGQEKINEAQKKVSQHDSPQHRLELAEARADAQFEVSKARCGDHIGDAKKACEDEAKAMRDLSKARAKRQALAQAASKQSSGGSSETGASGSASATSGSSQAVPATPATAPSAQPQPQPQPQSQSQPQAPAAQPAQ